MSRRIIIPNRPLIRHAPDPFAVLPRSHGRGLGVRFRTELCDASGRIERVLTPWRANMITDTGMNNLAAASIPSQVNYLNLCDTGQTLKRLGGGVEFTVTWTSPTDITVTTDAGFFEAGDEGRTLFINDDDWPELEITSFVGTQEVDCVARNSAWLPGFTPPASPAGPYTDVGVHYTDLTTLANEFTRFNTYDTGSSNNNAELNDSANSRRIHQRIFLGPVVTGTDWTVNALGWSNNSANVFGQATLGSADTVPVNKRYRVTLQLFSAYDVIDLTGVSLDWGATIGTHTCDVRMERIGRDVGPSGTSTSPDNSVNMLLPAIIGTWRSWVTASAFSMLSTAWHGDAGFTSVDRGSVGQFVSSVFDSTYSSGTFTRTRTLRWPEGGGITNGTMFGASAQSDASPSLRWPGLTIRPDGTTITKPSSWRMELGIPIHWTRELIN